MPALVAKDLFLQITWLGIVTERSGVEVETEPRKSLDLDWNGVLGGAHSGRHRASDSRVLQQHKKIPKLLMCGSSALLAEKRSTK